MINFPTQNAHCHVDSDDESVTPHVDQPRGPSKLLARGRRASSEQSNVIEISGEVHLASYPYHLILSN